MILSLLQRTIANKIIEYVCQRNLPARSRLTETGLAKEFSVSRSPVRVALRELEKKGFVVVTGNKGYRLAIDAASIGKTPLTNAVPLYKSLYDRIALDRVRCRIPDHITEAAFLRRYDIPRSELLRTLAQMSHDGLIERSIGHGWIFLPSLNSKSAYAASYRFRSIVEPSGLREDTFRLDKAALIGSRKEHQENLHRAIHNKLTGRQVFNINARFHEMLARMSGNQFIVQAIESQNRLRKLSEYYVYNDDKRIRTIMREHCEIIDALLSGDREWAAALLQRHLEIAGRLGLSDIKS